MTPVDYIAPQPNMHSRSLSLVLKFIGGTAVIVLSFWITLLVLDNLGSFLSQSLKSEFVEFGQVKDSRPIDVRISIAGSWALDGYYPAVGPAPLPGKVYGSWNGADSNTGVLTYSGVSSKSGTLSIPIVTGPNTGNLSIAFLEPGTGKVIGTVQPSVHPKWALLKIVLPSAYVNVPIEIRISDNGTTFGQWLAVGVPHQ